MCENREKQLLKFFKKRLVCDFEMKDIGSWFVSAVGYRKIASRKYFFRDIVDD